MIIVTRLNGEPFGLNSDLIERVEAMPDTVITLVDGKKLLVREDVDAIIDRVVAYRASILRRAEGPPDGATPTLADLPEHRPPSLRLVAEAELERPERG